MEKLLIKEEIQEITSLDKNIVNYKQWKARYCDSDLGISDFLDNKELLKEDAEFIWCIILGKTVGMYKNDKGIYKDDKVKEFGYRDVILIDFNQVVSDKFITKEKANGYFDVFICYFAIKKITKDEIYLKLKKIAFSKGFTLNIDEAQLTMVY